MYRYNLTFEQAVNRTIADSNVVADVKHEVFVLAGDTDGDGNVGLFAEILDIDTLVLGIDQESHL